MKIKKVHVVVFIYLPEVHSYIQPDMMAVNGGAYILNSQVLTCASVQLQQQFCFKFKT